VTDQAGPVRPPPKIGYNDSRASTTGELPRANAIGDSDTTVDSADQSNERLDGGLEDSGVTRPKDTDVSSQSSGSVEVAAHQTREVANNTRKRKHRMEEDGLERAYFLRLAKEEEEEGRRAKRRLKHQKLIAEQDPNKSEKGDFGNEGLGESEKTYDSNVGEDSKRSMGILHETLVPDKEAIELEKSTRTVFLANVSILAITNKEAKKKLLEHMMSFVDSLPVSEDNRNKHKVESIRFRSTAYSKSGLPKKAAYVTKSLMDTTTKSTNAYAVYSTALAAREAVKRLNGTMILDRHLRVDGIAHPAKTDHRRCVFVGNLGFVDDESMIDQDGKNERKRSKVPSDIEEGLWRQFSKIGAVESVRVVRDKKTRVGKGFAYVQFQVSFHFSRLCAEQP
jgi:nucleolar protein 12